MISLEVTKRDSSKSAGALRKSGVLPAVFYGPKESSTPIAVSYAVFERVWNEAGETTILSLTGVGEPKEVLIQDVAVDPVTGSAQHVDFYVLEKGKKLEIAVPLEFIGISPAEKEGIGVVVKVLHEIEISVTPAELPQHLDVDISNLKAVGDEITVAQIKLPPSAELKTNPKEIVVLVNEQKIVEEIATKPPTDEELAALAGAETAPEGGEIKEEKKEKAEKSEKPAK